MNRHSLAVLILLAAASSQAQEPLPLDADCTVTVGNQTALVRLDGTFYVQNISVFRSRVTGAAPQLYRARATCLRNGEMLTGQSEFFSLSPNDVTLVASVLPSAIDPIPVAVTATAPLDVVALGETVQLTALAELPDGAVEDVTPRSAGTTYLSTNPSLLTVTEDGLVTGANTTTSPQTATIAVLNEGNLAAISLQTVGLPNDFDNDGLPNDYEELFGLDPLVDDAGLDPDGDGLTNLQEFEIGTLPNALDTDLDSIPDGLDANPLRPDEDPPAIAFVAPDEGRTLFEGETLSIRADVTDDGLVAGADFRVNGASLRTLDAPPFELLFTVPFEASFLDFEIEASDSVGRTSSVSRSLSVLPDPLTTVAGTVTDTGGVPVAGAEVAVVLRGLVGEFFDFETPLSALPDLSGLTPDLIRPVSAVNFRNPESLLSLDTFGVGLAPDFAARFSGFLETSVSGTYSFTLGADDGARLTVDGALVAEVVPGAGFTEAQGTIDLPAGELAVEIEYFQGVDDAELQLSFVGPNGGRPAVVPPSLLVQSSSLFTASSAGDGTFSVPDVPAALGEIRAAATAAGGGEDSRGISAATEPEPGGVTDVGAFPIAPDFCVALANPGFEDDPDPDFRWQAQNQGSGAWFFQTGTTTPLGRFSIPTPPEGLRTAMTDMNGPGRHILFQDFTLPAAPPAVLSFELYLGNRADSWIVAEPPTLSHTDGPNQHVRVDVMDPSAPLDDVGEGVLLNVFLVREGDPLESGYQTITADLSAVAGRTVRLRFAEVDSVLFLNVGVDNVQICSGAAMAQPAAARSLGTDRAKSYDGALREADGSAVSEGEHLERYEEP